MTAMQPLDGPLAELPPCTTYADRMHRFQRRGEPCQIFDDDQLELGDGTGFPCKCGAALIHAPQTGPGFQLVAPIPDHLAGDI